MFLKKKSARYPYWYSIDNELIFWIRCVGRGDIEGDYYISNTLFGGFCSCFSLSLQQHFHAWKLQMQLSCWSPEELIENTKFYFEPPCNMLLLSHKRETRLNSFKTNSDMRAEWCDGQRCSDAVSPPEGDSCDSGFYSGSSAHEQHTKSVRTRSLT